MRYVTLVQRGRCVAAPSWGTIFSALCSDPINKSARALEERQCVHTCAYVMGSSLERITLHRCLDPNPLEYGEINYIGPEKLHHMT